MSKDKNQSPILLKPACRARGGVHPVHNKFSAEQETVKIPLPERVYIPLRQHIGAPCLPTVSVGDQVYIGTKLGDSDAPISAPVHSSVSGVVEAITPMAGVGGGVTDTVVILVDEHQQDDPNLHPITVETADDLVKAARDCGLVGLGGAGFPTHIKLKPNQNQPIDTLIINAAECEPYITSDYRACMEDGELIMQGIQTLLRTLQVKQVIIGIENNKPKAIEKLVAIAREQQDEQNRIRVMKLPSHYPHGAEKVLVQVATGRRIAMGALPASVGCAVMNISGVAVLQHYINTGMPLTRRRVTVDGWAVKRPKNFWVPVGTLVQDLLAHVSLKSTPHKIIMGGPMMGSAQYTTHIPVVKQTNAVLLFDQENDLSAFSQGPCIRCGKCVAACPMSLMPTLIERFAKTNDIENLRRVGVGVCMECGSCAFNCPAHRPLVQYMRLAKEIERKGRT